MQLVEHFSYCRFICESYKYISAMELVEGLGVDCVGDFHEETKHRMLMVVELSKVPEDA